MAEMHTFPDICTPQARLARPLSKDGYLTIEKFLASCVDTSWTWPEWWMEAEQQHQSHVCCMQQWLPLIGSGPRHQILQHVFARCASQKTHWHTRITRLSRARCENHTRYTRFACDSRMSVCFWLAKRAKKCDTNHIPRATTELPTIHAAPGCKAQALRKSGPEDGTERRQSLPGRDCAKDFSPGWGERRWALPLQTAQPTRCGGVQHTQTGGIAADPQQNASESTVATVQKDECGLLVAHP